MSERADPRCNSYACARTATVFETVEGEPWRWCAECWQEMQEERRAAHELIAAAREIARAARGAAEGE